MLCMYALGSIMIAETVPLVLSLDYLLRPGEEDLGLELNLNSSDTSYRLSMQWHVQQDRCPAVNGE